jgi:hypothetical protein
MSKANETSTDNQTEAKAEAPARKCACGCEATVGKRSFWKQGHDARAKGWLQRVAKGRCFEGETELVAALLERKEARAALETEFFVPLVEKAQAKLSKPKAS